MLKSANSKRQPGGALYIAWHFDSAEGSPSRVWTRLSNGERQHLFRLRSGVVVDGEARALMQPCAALETITAAICETKPVATRWVATERACAMLSREIESVPVNLGLALRPEEWPLSSASVE